MIGFLHVKMLHWLRAFMFTCHNDGVLLYLHALMITCPLACMPTCLYAFEIICLDALMITYYYFEMLRWLHAHMHWYSHVWYPYTCTHTWMMKCLLARRLKWSCSSKFLCSNVLTIVLECSDGWEIRGMCTWMLKCSYACILS